MTRATLLRLLAHPTALNGADVRALEELAEAFPYCQTAHLLLAKAAHDQGSMLAGQRLRRAATYAADRALLRQLVEAAPVEELVEALPATVAAEYADKPSAAFAADEPALPPAEATATAAPPPEDQPTPDGTLPPSPPASQEVPRQADALAAPAHPAPVAEAGPAPADLAPSPLAADPAPETTAGPDSNTEATAPAAVAALGTEAEPVSPEPAPGLPAAAAAAADIADIATEPHPEASETSATPSDPAQAPADPAEQAVIDASAAAANPPAPGEELPPQAPPIRPPAEAEAARQEFGLGPAEPAQIAPYQLPELELAITIPLTPADATPRLPPFSGVADVAYAPGEGSRFGYCLVPATPPAGEADPLVPGAALPPPGEFFGPDALLLAHVATQPVAATSSTTDLINSFLLRTPSSSRRRPQPAAKASEQADLSVRSTRAAPDLASESLARILTQQGKIEQAIAIYERLMVKNPEKMAYFAAQIDLLRP